MTTKRQLEANQRNAAKSTGPRTDEGKQASRLNAIKHGLLADTVFVPSLDDRDEWERFRADLLESLQPGSALEDLLAERMVGTAWRLARVARFERDAIDDAIEAQRLAMEPEAKRQAAQRSYRTMKEIEGTMGRHKPQLPKLFMVEQIARYEGHLHRQFMQCLHELQRVQARRLGTSEAAPAAVDIVLSHDVIERAPEA
jgi:hypothetical protein